MPTTIPREKIDAMAGRILELLGRADGPITFNMIATQLECTSPTTVQRALAQLVEEGRVEARQQRFRAQITGDNGEWLREFDATGYRLAQEKAR